MAGLGNSAGTHRLWSHRSYKARMPLRLLLAIFHTLSMHVRTLSRHVRTLSMHVRTLSMHVRTLSMHVRTLSMHVPTHIKGTEGNL